MAGKADDAEWDALPERVQQLIRDAYRITRQDGACTTCGNWSNFQADGSEYVHCSARNGCALGDAPDPLTAIRKAFADYLAKAPSKIVQGQPA